MTQQTVDPLLQAFPVLLPEPGRFLLPLRCRQKVLQKQNLLLPFRFGNQSVFIEKRQFNNTVRTMLRQAYGYRDDEYMILKIYDLPNRKLQVVI